MLPEKEKRPRRYEPVSYTHLYGSYARGENQSEELELKYGTIVSPTVIPFDEFEKYKNDLPYYRNIETEGEEIVA